MVAIAIVVLLVVGGGVSYTAESSAPGDALYGVKTSVNENVRATIAVGAEADAKWEAELAKRRLTEANRLSDEGKLQGETMVKLFTEFEAHADAALEMAESLRAEGNAEAAASVESDVNAAIRMHDAVFAKLEGAGSSVNLSAVLNRAAATVGLETDANRDAQVRVGDMDQDGKPDTDQSDTGASIESETKAEIDGGASVESNGSIKVGL